MSLGSLNESVSDVCFGKARRKARFDDQEKYFALEKEIKKTKEELEAIEEETQPAGLSHPLEVGEQEAESDRKENQNAPVEGASATRLTLFAGFLRILVRRLFVSHENWGSGTNPAGRAREGLQSKPMTSKEN